jgi:hypothetical protein
MRLPRQRGKSDWYTRRCILFAPMKRWFSLADAKMQHRSKLKVAAPILIAAACTYLVWPYVFPNPDIGKILAKKRLEVFLYDSGRVSAVCTLPPGSDGQRAVLAVLSNHRRQWMLNVIALAPSLFIRDDDFEIDFHKDVIALNYTENGWIVSVISVTHARDIDTLLRALKGSWHPFEE